MHQGFRCKGLICACEFYSVIEYEKAVGNHSLPVENIQVTMQHLSEMFVSVLNDAHVYEKVFVIVSAYMCMRFHTFRDENGHCASKLKICVVLYITLFN